MGYFSYGFGRLINNVNPGISNDIAETINSHGSGVLVHDSDPKPSSNLSNLLQKQLESDENDPITEAYMTRLLDKRYNKSNKSGFPRNIVASQASLDGMRRIDYFVAEPFSEEILNEDDVYERFGAPLHGFEIKISRSDWLRELKTNGEKSQFWRDRVNYWWIVVPDKDIIKDGELPDGWGLLVGTKRLRIVVKPKRFEVSKPLTPYEAFSIARCYQYHLKKSGNL